MPSFLTNRNQPKITKAAVTLLGLGLFFLVLNIMFTVVSLRDNPNMSFFELFFATRDSNGHLRGAAIVWAWAPIILLPLGGCFAWIAARRRTTASGK